MRFLMVAACALFSSGAFARGWVCIADGVEGWGYSRRAARANAVNTCGRWDPNCVVDTCYPESGIYRPGYWLNYWGVNRWGHGWRRLNRWGHRFGLHRGRRHGSRWGHHRRGRRGSRWGHHRRGRHGSRGVVRPGGRTGGRDRGTPGRRGGRGGRR